MRSLDALVPAAPRSPNPALGSPHVGDALGEPLNGRISWLHASPSVFGEQCAGKVFEVGAVHTRPLLMQALNASLGPLVGIHDRVLSQEFIGRPS